MIHSLRSAFFLGLVSHVAQAELDVISPVGDVLEVRVMCSIMCDCDVICQVSFSETFGGNGYKCIDTYASGSVNTINVNMTYSRYYLKCLC